MRARIPGTFPGVSRTREVEAFDDGGWEKSASGLYVPRQPKRRYERPVAIDLFSGVGGFSLGTIQAGFQVVAALDNDEDAAITYLYNLGAYPVNIHFATDEDKERLEGALQQSFKEDENGVWRGLVSGGNRRPEFGPGVEHFFFGDIRQFTGAQILEAIGLGLGEVDLVMGGPPCQGFSYAGLRNVVDPRNSLVFEFARLVLEMLPKAMAMENVPGMLSMVTPDGMPVIDTLCRVLADGGFGTYEALKKSLANSAGAGAALRGRKVSKSSDVSEPAEEEGAQQMALF